MANFLGLWHALEHAIVNYTGLSPTTFFTVLSIALAFYYIVSGWFQTRPPLRTRSREMEMEPVPPPVQLGEVTEEKLTAYDGSDPKKPLLMAIKGQIYDVTQSRMFYGPGGPYALFAGKDASRALAKMSFEEKDLTGDISGLGPFELDALQDWEYKFMSKYVKVGTIKKTVPVTDANTSETVETSTQTAEGEHFAESKEVETKEDNYVSEPIEVEPKEEKHASEPIEVQPKEEKHASEPIEVQPIEVQPKEEKHASEPIEVQPKEEKHVSDPIEVETKEIGVGEGAKE